jgi:hypothetical protein
LEGDLQPTLRLFGPFLLTKIKLLKFYIITNNIGLIPITTKEKSFYFNLWLNNPREFMGKESNSRKHSFMFLSPWKKAFDIYNINLILSQNYKMFFIQKLLCCLTRANCHLKDIQVEVFINFFINNATFRFNTRLHHNDIF